MSNDFYRKEFEKYGISVFVPKEENMSYIHEKTMVELADGEIVESTRKRLVEISRKMVLKEDIQALILGSTELSLILNERVLEIPTLDTAKIGIQKAFDYIQE